ncbi:peptide-methionine (S)-S-oxide reductase MsrA [Halomonas rhizosphaerae]|uniref:Peptide methionine sulfoxide reductase MsrA n=1 Tax=Halomonas rhizosphaerae TaxID=3043296 RepID=A0ABT6V4G0_9GAMM|nr:peptide-methionine (S)-S-oxide reductase MsrA [Halomonas rhizosphaerae]MDI5893129.1 peptide-methionine (S)-S-oxide reductase MsrA [Halomonas rhizosphaerae]MDI5922914.1 peptide-methionine (S)-S-oxide reductase MsrA [Halomonas rhizosphaerae]
MSLLPFPAFRRLTLLALPTVLAIAGTAQADEETASAVFAGGCFWCMEEAYDQVEGVLETTSGYSGGRTEDPTYEQVTAGGTGHAEVVKVDYDPDRVDYETLLHVFWRNIDPFAEDRQFCDKGASYRSAIFPLDAEQRALAEASRDAVAERFDEPIATEINDFEAFYPAEAYHQDYYLENPVRYRFYKSACGRVERLEEVWGDEAGASAAS